MSSLKKFQLAGAHPRSWAFMFPVGELILTEAVDREFRVDRVTLVHKDKLPRVRQRLSLGAPVSEIKKFIKGWDFFESGGAFAVVRQTGEPEDVEPQALKIIREELSILAVSQLGYHKRNQMGPIVAPREVPHPYISYLAVSSEDRTRFGSLFRRTAPLGQVALDEGWKNYQDRVFFTKLLRILRGDTEVAEGWRKELRRAVTMIGESVGANDIFKSFLWNWIALETLLIRPQDRIGETLPKRAEALLGWALLSDDLGLTHWSAGEYTARIQNIYNKRNGLLHQGKRDGITDEDIEFTDHLLLNLLSNLVAFPKLFRSKDAIVEFSAKVEAERILDVTPRVRPKDLRFTWSLSGPESRLKIEYRVGEWWDLPQSWRDEAQNYDGDAWQEPQGCFFRVSNSGSSSVPIWDSYVEVGGRQLLATKRRLPPGRRLYPGESVMFLVPGQEFASKLLEQGHGDNTWATFVIKESATKSHKKSFEITLT